MLLPKSVGYCFPSVFFASLGAYPPRRSHLFIAYHRRVFFVFRAMGIWFFYIRKTDLDLTRLFWTYEGGCFPYWLYIGLSSFVIPLYHILERISIGKL